MDWRLVLGVAALVIRATTGFARVVDAYRGVHLPQRSTWLIFLVLNIVYIVAQWAEGATYSLFGLFASTGLLVLIGPRVPSQGVGGFDGKDYGSLLVAAVGLGLWAVTDQPVLALLISLTIDLAGAWLLVEKTYRLPWSETLLTWQGATVSGALILFTIDEAAFELIVIPLYLFLLALTMAVVISWRRRVVPRPA